MMKRIFSHHFHVNTYYELLYRIALVLIFMQITRWIFFAYNINTFAGLSCNEVITIALGGLRFDLTAVMYLNIPYILMRILPFGFVYNSTYIKISNWFYGVGNIICVGLNITDAPFYKFTGVRTQAVHLAEIACDSNSLDVFFGHLHTYWYFAILSILFLVLFIYLAMLMQPKSRAYINYQCGRTIIIKSVLFLIFGGATFLGIRGNVQAGYPISVSDASLYCSRPKDVALVLNTPFTIMRTLGKNNTLPQINYFSDNEVLQERNNIHQADTAQFSGKNIVMIILEGTGNTFIDSLNCNLKQSKPFKHSLTPFLNSLAARSYVNTNFFTNCRRSSAGITSTLGGFPAYNPFVYMLSPYSSNDVDGLARLLDAKGYDSRFYCGCNQGSYAFSAMSHTFGYHSFVDRVKYIDTYGDRDYDGSWGIYDSAMAKHIAGDIETMKQPFIASWFTLNTHGPYSIPDEYKSRYRSPVSTMANTVEYIDDVLSQFFADASKQDWYNNTIFIITADHGSTIDNKLYDNPLQLHRIPLIIFTPDGSIAPQRSNVIGSQMDITPTLLSLLHYDKEYFALGQSVINPEQKHFALFDCEGQYNMVKGEYLLQLDMITMRPVSLYHYATDPYLKENIIRSKAEEAATLERECKIFLQDYTNRITKNKMSMATK